jgi:hypothetical protein
MASCVASCIADGKMMMMTIMMMMMMMMMMVVHDFVPAARTRGAPAQLSVHFRRKDLLSSSSHLQQQQQQYTYVHGQARGTREVQMIHLMLLWLLACLLYGES